MARPLAANGNCPILTSQPSAFGLFRRQAGGDQFRVGEADGGDRALVPAALVAGDDLGHHFALRHRPMRQHRLAGDVADGEDAAHRGAALVVDADEFSAHVEVDLLEAPAFGHRLAPDRDQDLVGRDLGALAVRRLDQQRIALGRQCPWPWRPVITSMPSSASRLTTGRVSSASYCASTRGSASTTVTLAPILAKAMPSSSPI